MSDFAPPFPPTPSATSTLQSSSYSLAQWTDLLVGLHPDPWYGMTGSGCSFSDQSDEDMKACSDHPFCALCEVFGWLQACRPVTFSDPTIGPTTSISNQFGEAVPGVHESAQIVQRRFSFKKVRKVQKVQRKRARARVSRSFSDYEVIERIEAGGPSRKPRTGSPVTLLQ